MLFSLVAAWLYLDFEQQDFSWCRFKIGSSEETEQQFCSDFEALLLSASTKNVADTAITPIQSIVFANQLDLFDDVQQDWFVVLMLSVSQQTEAELTFACLM